MSLKGIFSSIGLIGLILFDAILIAICFICHQLWWAYFFIGITALVIIFEIVSKITTGKTISQHWWAWSQENKKMKWWSIAGIIAFLLAMNSLALHLLAPILAKLFGA